ncbi:MAG: heparinase II/III family protein [Armatimonadetes bacterium]|nr:heparinase II/III family protein [Armatimonadota bacterium]
MAICASRSTAAGGGGAGVGFGCGGIGTWGSTGAGAATCGTAAHNTVRVDGRDQARQDSPFKWSDPYAAELVAHTVRHDGIIVLEARHDGYADLGVMHTRKVIVVPDTLVIVRDTLSGAGMHELELHWHCGVEPERFFQHYFETVA